MGAELTHNTTQTQLGEQVEWAKLVASSDIIPDSYKGKPANILIATGFGASMGLSQAESLYRISVIKGKPTMSAELIAAQVRKAGHKLRIVKDEEHTSVTATIVRSDDPDYPISVTRDMEWAHRMGLDKPSKSGKPSNYQTQPMTMLTWRAITAVAREAAPEALFGVAYTPDEMHDMDDVTVSPQREETPTPIAEPVQGEVMEPMARYRDRQEVSGLLVRGGVTTPEQASEAFKYLLSRDISSTKQLTREEAERLLSDPERVINLVTELLNPQTESETTPEPAVTQSTLDDGFATDEEKQ